MNASGRVVASASEDFRQIYPKPGWVEHNPEDIWATTLSTLRACLRKGRVKGSQVAGIGIANQRETTLLWDRKTGRAAHNAIVWQDRRTSDACAALRAEGLEPLLAEKTGLVIDPYFSSSKLAWLLAQGGLRGRAEKGRLAAGTVDSFLLWRLSGGSAHITDVSNASRTQLMNLQKAEWDDDLLKLFRVPRALLPDIGPSSAGPAGPLARTKGLGFLPDGIPIAGIAGDQQAALFGQACFAEGESKCTFGTGSFLLMNTGERVARSRSRLLSTAAWRLGSSPVVYALEGGAFVCGAAVQFLRDQMGIIKDSGAIEALAKQAKNDTGGVEFVPALAGLGAPHWDADARGLICGLTRGTTRAQLALATLEAMALQNAEILQAMERDLGARMRSLRVDGGASANGLLMQKQADYLGVEVVRPKQIETTSAGAAFLAGLGVGLWGSLDDVRRAWKAQKAFRPKIDDAARAERLRRWARAVARARGAC
jgi:glycerol kinase